jgi:hypothetical protein
MGLVPIYVAYNPRLPQSGPEAIAISISGGLFLVILSALIFRGASRVSVVLRSDEIESNGVWTSAIMRFSNIRGRRNESGGNSSVTRTILLPVDKKQTKLVIKDGLGFAYDDFYRNWLAAIPDLDAIDLAQRRKDGKLRIWET